MKNEKWFLVSGILILIGLLICIFSISLYDWDLKKLDRSPDFIRKETSLNVSNMDSIVVKSINHDILIEPSQDEKIHIIYYENENHTYKIEQNENKLQISYHNSKSWWEQIINSFKYQINFKESEIKIIVSIPSTSLFHYEVKNVNGNIMITNTTGKTLKLKNTNGNSQINSTHFDSIKSSSINGNIMMNHISSDTIELKNTNGNSKGNIIKSNDINLKSTNGTIDFVIDGEEDNYRRTIKSINGSSNIENRNKGKYHLDAYNTNGNIKIKFTA